ncbi:MAG: hypothetical protein FJ404_08375 [Verrucomicrobia bacterium]|nr:hypothetical protein [Verrucomicrobiota bacterium]
MHGGVPQDLFGSIQLAQRIVIRAQKNGVVGDGFLHDAAQIEQIGGVDHGVNALLEALHGVHGLKVASDEEDGRVPSQIHGHGLERAQGDVFLGTAALEALLQDDQLILNLREAHDEVFVGQRRVDLVFQFVQHRLGDGEVIRSRQGQQRRLVFRTDEFEFEGHGGGGVGNG